MSLDRYDRTILQALQHEGRLPNSELAARVNLSESACLRRIRALEASGLIEGYAAILNEQKAGLGVNVFVSITLERQERADLAAFEQAVRKVPEVMECYLMSGDYDYLLRVVVADTADFERVHSRHLTSLPACRAGPLELCVAHGAEVPRTAGALNDSRGLRRHRGAPRLLPCHWHAVYPPRPCWGGPSWA